LATSSYAQDLRDTEHLLNKTRNNLNSTKKELTIAKIREKDIKVQLLDTQKNLKVVKDKLSFLGEEISTTKTYINKLGIELQNIESISLETINRTAKKHQDYFLFSNNVIRLFLNKARNLPDLLNLNNECNILSDLDNISVNIVNARKKFVNINQTRLMGKYEDMLSDKNNIAKQYESLEVIQYKRKELLGEAKKESEYLINRKEKLEEHTEELESEIQNLINLIQTRNNPFIGSLSAIPNSTGEISWPTSGYVTSEFGYRIHPIAGNLKFHTGIDIGADYGTPIEAADGGRVIYNSWFGGYGNTIIIDHGKGIVTLYAHCSELFVKSGQLVVKGQKIALVGSTGNSTGPHLHFEVRKNGEPTNPFPDI
jgi:murein DD-endopeptidase MepM/ murein hydrolase activator NlpD